MVINPWSAKRKRQYSHITKSLVERGKSKPVAKEIAARIVNKVRVQHGESTTASTSSMEDMPDKRRRRLRSHLGPLARTVLQLREDARQRGIKGRSKMSKTQLQHALQRQ